MKRFILGDPSLIGYSGHCFEYLWSLARLLQARGHATVLIGNRSLSSEIAAQSGALPMITYWCDARPVLPGMDGDSKAGREYIRHQHEQAMLTDLRAIDAKVGFAADDVLFLNTLRHWPIRGLVKWAEELGAARAPTIVLVLHFTAFPSLEWDDGTFAMYRDAFAAIEASPVRHKFRLLADSDGLIEEYREVTNLPVQLAPIPHSHRPVTLNLPDASQELVISYVGEARENKGYHLLPHLVDEFERSDLAGRATFHIQSYIANPRDGIYRRAMGRLANCARVVFFPDEMDAAEYEAYVSAAHIILVPYLTDNYHRQTSGIYAEAAALGIPTIAPRGTWMAQQVKQYGGGRLFVPNDPQSLFEATYDAVANYATLVEDARQAATQWNSFHRPEVLVEQVLEVTNVRA